MIPELQGALSGEGYSDPMPVVRTEVQVFRSGVLLPAVIDELQLVDDPEFNPALRPPTLFSKLRMVFSLFLGSARESQEPSASAIRNVILGEVQRKLGVAQDSRSLVIDLTFTANDPDKAAAVLNVLIHHYMQTRIKARSDPNREANAALLGRVQELHTEVEALDQQVQKLRDENNLVVLRAGSVGQQQLENLAAALTQASTERAQTEATWQRATAEVRAGRLPTEQDSVLSSPTIARLRDQEATVTRRLAEMTGRYGLNHPDRRSAEAELTSARAQIMAEAHRIITSLGSQLQASRAREAEITRQLDSARDAATRVAGVQAELSRLEKEADARRQLYQTLLSRAEQTSAEGRGMPQLPGARIISLASAPLDPSSPRPLLAGMLGLFGGGAFGGLLVLVRGPGSRGFVQAQEILQEVGLQTLAVLPRVEIGRQYGSLANRVVAAPAGTEAEILRLLRTRLRFMGRAGTPRCVVFASSVAGEGASSIAAAFARVAALDGVRTLLLEGDLRHPSLTGLLSCPEGIGTARALEGTATWHKAVTRDPTTPLDLIVGGKPHSGAQHLLEGMRFQNLLTEATENYDLVVADTPPLTIGSDAAAMVHCADVVVLVVEASVTRREVVREVVECLARASRTPTVAILNKARWRSDGARGKRGRFPGEAVAPAGVA